MAQGQGKRAAEDVILALENFEEYHNFVTEEAQTMYALLILSLLLPLSVLASDWKLLAHNPTSKIYVDLESIQKLDSGNFSFWMKEIEKDNKQNESTTMWLLEVTCTGKSRRLDYKNLGTTNNGKQVITFKDMFPDVEPKDYVTDWKFNSPDTPEESAEKQICNKYRK